MRLVATDLITHYRPNPCDLRVCLGTKASRSETRPSSSRFSTASASGMIRVRKKPSAIDGGRRKLQRSVEATISRGHYEWTTFLVDDDGTVRENDR